jgi:hypothetical protein
MSDAAEANRTVTKPARRLWLIFFRESPHAPWWRRLLRRGYRHVTALSFYADAGTWVMYDPSYRITVEIYQSDEFVSLFDELEKSTSLILRIPSSSEGRTAPPFTAWCVGSLKGLLGIHCWAITPWQLRTALLARGAEIVWESGQMLLKGVAHNVIPFNEAASAAKAVRLANRSGL